MPKKVSKPETELEIDPTFNRTSLKSEFWHLKFATEGETEDLEYLFTMYRCITSQSTAKAQKTKKDKDDLKYVRCNLCTLRHPEEP